MTILQAAALFVGGASLAALTCGVMGLAFVVHIVRERFRFGTRMLVTHGWTADRLFECLSLIMGGVIGIIVAAVVWRIAT